MNIIKILKMLIYFWIVGLMSLFAIPFLGAFLFAFGVVSLVSIPAGIIRTFFNTSWINMSFLGHEIPKIFSIPVSILIFLMSFIFSYVSYKLLKLYFNFIINTYRKINK